MQADIGDAVMIDRLAGNQEAVNRLKTISTLVAGMTAGILGITGWYGALVFVLFNVLAATILKTLTGTSSKSYFVGGSQELFSFSALSSGALTFVFVWTIVYDVIYIF